MSIEILAPGLLTTVQDGGRLGYAAIGVGAGGAMDGVALRLANILVGNVDNAAALEITLRGPRLRFRDDSLIAITGADIDARSDALQVPTWRPVWMRAGAELAVGNIRSGARCYLAVAGGIDVPMVLGSRSVDVNTRVGGRPLVAGDILPATPTAFPVPASSAFVAAKWSLDPAPWFDHDCAQPLALTPGTHFSDLDDGAHAALFNTAFRISADSNRVGYRLEGTPLRLRKPLELVSAGIVPGTIQLPPNGAPIVLMAEAPTTGGYPRIAHVIATDLPRLAQHKPGDSLRFTQVSLGAAQKRYLEREQALARIANTVSERLHDPL
jgi:antagonist of KipI